LTFIWKKNSRVFKNRYIITIISVVFLIFIWHLSAVYIAAEIILPYPITVLKSLILVLFSQNFLIKLFYTLLRGLLGFIISYISGIFIGVLAGIFKTFRTIITPIISVIRSTPVISVILLALIWFDVNYVPIFVAFLMAFPIVCGNIIEGITTVDKNLLEMANVYNIPLKKQIFKIYIPSIVPFIIAGASLSLGVVWKVIIAAEVLSQPKWGVGTSLNEAKSYLITEEVFAWTIIAILLSSGTEYLFNQLIKRRKK